MCKKLLGPESRTIYRTGRDDAGGHNRATECRTRVKLILACVKIFLPESRMVLDAIHIVRLMLVLD